jgi:hypothetical protein
MLVGWWAVGERYVCGAGSVSELKMRREKECEVDEFSAMDVSRKSSWLFVPYDCCTALPEALLASTRSRRNMAKQKYI